MPIGLIYVFSSSLLSISSKAGLTASAQETVHFLRLASEKTRLEVAKLKSETAMLESKKKVLDASEQAAVEYSKVLDALKLYQGRNDD